MMSTDQQTFEGLWEKFIVRLKGRMLRQSEKQPLDGPVVKLLLMDAALSWDSEQDECGRWLHSYAQDHPEKGKLLRDILVEDMHFTELAPQKELPEALTYVLPLAGAAVGLGAATYFQAGWLVKAAATVGPGVLLYPAVKAVGDSGREKNRRDAIGEYLDQLDKYKQSALSVLDG